MITPWRGAALALLALGSAPLAPASAQGPPLAFYGFRAGVPLRDADAQVRLLLGPGLTCRRSQADPRLQDCRATITDPVLNSPVSVWLAAIDSLTGVVTVSATLGGADLLRWRDELEVVYGIRPATMDGPQGMVQWIRGQQMLRLTWRYTPGRTQASVSLVDGPVMDGWNLRGADSTRIANPRPPR
ncbi:MAG TPA: hypothetical protein PK948_02680 [Gemmatimonadales bacterium]|nr:hypothetical protein [Gemmatimonadales bacterium]